MKKLVLVLLMLAGAVSMSIQKPMDRYAGFDPETFFAKDPVEEWLMHLNVSDYPKHVQDVLLDTVKISFILQTAEEYEIPASVMLAQTILETGWWRHTPGNALFGIKGTGQILTTPEEINGVIEIQTHSFRKYDFWEQSIRDYADMMHRKYYRNVSYTEALDILEIKGYATSSQYKRNLNCLIVKYQLYELDRNRKEFPSTGDEICPSLHLA